MDNLSWLDQFFGSLTDGEWESEFGITIESVNNPGWMVRIDLDGTGLNPSTFRTVSDQRTEKNWIECKVEEGKWLGGGGIGNLDEVLSVFRAWVEGMPGAGGGSGQRGSGDRRPGRPQGGGGQGRSGGGYGGSGGGYSGGGRSKRPFRK